MDADLDSAATGAVQAAFGYQGQKCSACSRLIVDEKVHDELMEKVVALTKSLKIGQPTEPDTSVAAVINKRSFDNTLDYIKKGESEGGKIVAGGSGVDEEGFFIEPTVIDDVEPGSTIEQEEIFAPVLAVICVQVPASSHSSTTSLNVGSLAVHCSGSVLPGIIAGGTADNVATGAARSKRTLIGSDGADTLPAASWA